MRIHTDTRFACLAALLSACTTSFDEYHFDASNAAADDAASAPDMPNDASEATDSGQASTSSQVVESPPDADGPSTGDASNDGGTPNDAGDGSFSTVADSSLSSAADGAISTDSGAFTLVCAGSPYTSDPSQATTLCSPACVEVGLTFTGDWTMSGGPTTAPLCQDPMELVCTCGQSSSTAGQST